MCLQSRLWNYFPGITAHRPLSMLRVRFAHRPQMRADKPRKLLALGCEGLLQAQPSDGDPQAKSSDLSCVSSTYTEKVSRRKNGRGEDGRKGGRNHQSLKISPYFCIFSASMCEHTWYMREHTVLCADTILDGSSKDSACQFRRQRFDPRVRKIPWRRKWQPTPGFLPVKSQGQRNLVVYSPCGHKKSDTTEQLNNKKRYNDEQT